MIISSRVHNHIYCTHVKFIANAQPPLCKKHFFAWRGLGHEAIITLILKGHLVQVHAAIAASIYFCISLMMSLLKDKV